MTRIVRGGPGPLHMTATATSALPQSRELRQTRLSGAAYSAACNPADSSVSSFARVIDIDFTKRQLVEVELDEASPDGFDW